MSTPHHSNKPHSAPGPEVAVHVKSYIIVLIALMFLTCLTVALSYFDFGSLHANIVVALIVATIKAGLVALIFMHLNHEKKQIYTLLAFTGFFAVGLFFLTWLHYADPIHLPG